jgi:hypothetical protein
LKRYLLRTTKPSTADVTLMNCKLRCLKCFQFRSNIQEQGHYDSNSKRSSTKPFCVFVGGGEGVCWLFIRQVLIAEGSSCVCCKQHVRRDDKYFKLFLILTTIDRLSLPSALSMCFAFNVGYFNASWNSRKTFPLIFSFCLSFLCPFYPLIFLLVFLSF